MYTVMYNVLYTVVSSSFFFTESQELGTLSRYHNSYMLGWLVDFLSVGWSVGWSVGQCPGDLGIGGLGDWEIGDWGLVTFW